VAGACGRGAYERVAADGAAAVVSAIIQVVGIQVVAFVGAVGDAIATDSGLANMTRANAALAVSAEVAHLGVAALRACGAAAVDVCLGSVVDVVGGRTAGTLTMASGAHAAQTVCRQIAFLRVRARGAGTAAAIHVCLVGVLDVVGRNTAWCLANLSNANTALAIAGAVATRVGAAGWAATAAAIDTCLSAILDTICGYTTGRCTGVGRADTALAIGVRVTVGVIGTGIAAAATVSVGLGTIAHEVIAARRLTTVAYADDAFAICVAIAVGAGCATAATSGQAAIDIGFVAVQDVVSARG